MSEREMPADLSAALRRAAGMDAFADTTIRHRNAVNATGMLLLAAFEAGWRLRKLAAVVDLKKTTVQKQIELACGRLFGHLPALIIEPPPDPRRGRRPKPTDVLRLPLEERSWLTAAEALEFVSRDRSTLTNWTRAGLLPNTIHVSSARLLFLRGDLKRSCGRSGQRATRTTRRCERRLPPRARESVRQAADDWLDVEIPPGSID